MKMGNKSGSKYATLAEAMNDTKNYYLLAYHTKISLIDWSSIFKELKERIVLIK